MLPYFLLGATWGFAAAAQPGPMQAYLISQAVNHGWRRALPIAFAPLLSDLPTASLSIFILSRVPAWFAVWLRLAGGLFVLYLAWDAFQMWRFPKFSALAAPLSAQRGAFKGALVNILNPNPWIAWTLVLGPLLVKAWRETPAHGIAFLTAFYGVLLSGMASTAVIFGLARRFGPGVTRVLQGFPASRWLHSGAIWLAPGSPVFGEHCRPGATSNVEQLAHPPEICVRAGNLNRESKRFLIRRGHFEGEVFRRGTAAAGNCANAGVSGEGRFFPARGEKGTRC